jgi:hypothetical protein
MSRKLNRFYCTSFARPEIPKIPYTSLRYEEHLMTYLWDIHEEIAMLNVIQYPTADLQALYDQLQHLLDYAIPVHTGYTPV